MDKKIIEHKDKDMEHIRINKFFSESGITSRREADKLVDMKRVTINGILAEAGSKVSPKDEVRLDGKLINKKDEQIYILLNKPRGIVCTTEKKIKDNIIDYVGYPKRIFPIGRLDKDSEGLIILTNDGDIVNKILRAGNNHEKEYIVTLDKPINNEFLSSMASGVHILDKITKPCIIKKINNNTFNIILTEGLNRQIRRMCQVFDFKVVSLKRIRIMEIKIDNLLLGKWRYLNLEELNSINRLINASIKTEEASR
ncbi:MAG TPA: pseudouridine synthase [Clostridiaceae bacterium]